MGNIMGLFALDLTCSLLCLLTAADSFKHTDFFAKVGLASKSADDIKKAFAVIDQDKSGFIEEDELKWVPPRDFIATHPISRPATLGQLCPLALGDTEPRRKQSRLKPSWNLELNWVQFIQKYQITQS